MVISWIDPALFRYVTIGVWVLVAVRGLVICYDNWKAARARAQAKDLADWDRRGRKLRFEVQQRLLRFEIAAVIVGAGSLVIPRPLAPVTVPGLFITAILIYASEAITQISKKIHRYEAEVIYEHKEQDDRTLEEIVAQLKTNDGSTVRDAIDRLEGLAKELSTAAATNSTSVGRLEILVVELGAKADLAADASAEAAAAAQVIAKNLEVAKEKVEAVEADLAESHRRAEEVAHGAEAGEAADAASRMTQAEKQGFEEQDNPED